MLLQRKLVEELISQTRFRWTTFDVRDRLPANWQKDILATAELAEIRSFPRTPVLSREDPNVKQILRGRVHAHEVRDHLPWLYKAYRNEILELANEVSTEHVSAASDDRYGVVLNVQQGTRMRFECHVDSNPLTGLLFCTDHAFGGELVVANDPTVQGITEIDKNSSVIRPRAGQLIFFDAHQHPHYARVLAGESEVRVVAVMNFYTESCPESCRPRELNRHLYGDEA